MSGDSNWPSIGLKNLALTDDESAGKDSLEVDGAKLALIASKAATLVLAVDGDHSIDLTGAVATADSMSCYLDDVFRSGLVGSLEAFTPEQAAILKIFINRLSAVQTDLFLIKSALARKQKFISGEAPNFTDPLAVLGRFSKQQPPLTSRTLTEFTIRLDANALGTGWHNDEVDASGKPFRWSGAGRRSTLVLPSPGCGKYRLICDYEVIDLRQAEGVRISINAGEPQLACIETGSSNNGQMWVEFDNVETDRSSFLFVTIDIPFTVSPAERGISADARQLGLRVNSLTFRTVI